MKKTVRAFLCLLLIFLSTGSCYFPAEPENPYRFAMFYLHNPDLSYSDAKQTSIDLLVLQQDPFLQGEDISSFTINYIPDNPIRGYHIKLTESSFTGFSAKVRPFVLILNGQRYLLGEYWPAPMAIIPKSVIFYRIGNMYEMMPGDDLGNNRLKAPEILSVLQELGVEIIYRDISASIP